MGTNKIEKIKQKLKRTDRDPQNVEAMWATIHTRKKTGQRVIGVKMNAGHILQNRLHPCLISQACWNWDATSVQIYMQFTILIRQSNYPE